MCSICLHYCKYYHPLPGVSEDHRHSANTNKDNHKPTMNKVEEEKNESTDLEEDATEEDEQDNKLFKIRKRLRI